MRKRDCIFYLKANKLKEENTLNGFLRLCSAWAIVFLVYAILKHGHRRSYTG
jgi:hypothetical protein